MDIDLEEIRRIFLAESLEDLVTVEQALLELERAPTSPEPLATVFRKFHSLKGSAATVGFDQLSGFAHRIEDLLDRLRAGDEPVTEEIISFLLQVKDALAEAIPLVVAGRENLTPGCLNLQARVDGGRIGASQAPMGEASRVSADALLDREPESGGDAARTLRIDVGKLDQLLTVTGEIAIARARLGLLIEGEGSPEVAQAYRTMELLLTNLHRFVTNVRMVPVRPLLSQYARVVRDLAVTHHKDIELVISDQGVEVDTSVVEQIKAPLTHMVRNSVHHGIETPDVRRRLGKRPRGRIDLRARHESGGIVIEVEDDGAGLDLPRILERARKLGLVGEAETPSEHDIQRLIFRQGLSTAGSVTSTSGRGVGMDVVLRHLDALGGSVDVESRPGERTLFVIRMPLTLAIIDGLLVRVGEGTFGLPMAGVVRCLDMPSSDSSAAEGVLNLRGQAIPFVRLRSVLSLTSEAPASEVVVVVQRGDHQIGIAVDRLLGKAQVVVKPLGRFFQGIPTLSGLTILGDGQVAPILNVAGVLQSAMESQAARTPLSGEHRKPESSAKDDVRAVAPTHFELEPTPAIAAAPVFSLSFFLGDEEYTVPMERIYEIVPFEAVTRVPTTPTFVKGLVNLQGLVIPVVDLAERFGAPAHDLEGRRSIVIVQTNVQDKVVLLGLVVDRLGRVLPMTPGQVQPAPRLESMICVDFLTGVFENNDRLVLCLDVDKLLGADESQEVAELAMPQAPETAQAHAKRQPYLSVRISSERCALNLDRLHEILSCGLLTRIPGAASFVLGATNVRGSAIPVLDLGKRFRMNPTRQGPESCLVLIDVDGAQSTASAALIVESVDGLFKLAPDAIDRTPPFGTRFPSHLVTGMADIGGEFVPILDTDRALAPGAIGEEALQG